MTFRFADVARIPLPIVTEHRIRQRGCESKVRHETEAVARTHMEGLYVAQKAAPGSLNVYECRVCAGWHVGHRSAA